MDRREAAVLRPDRESLDEAAREPLESESVSDLAAAYKLLATPVSEDGATPVLVPSEGEHVLIATDYGALIQIVPSADHPGYSFVTKFKNDIADGTTRAVRNDAIADVIRSCGDERPATSVVRIDGPPWRWNEWIFDSHEQYVERCVLAANA